MSICINLAAKKLNQQNCLHELKLFDNHFVLFTIIRFYFSQKHKVDRKMYPCPECNALLGSSQALIVSILRNWTEKLTRVFASQMAQHKCGFLFIRYTGDCIEEKNHLGVRNVAGRFHSDVVLLHICEHTQERPRLNVTSATGIFSSDILNVLIN